MRHEMLRELAAGVSGIVAALIAFSLVLTSYQPVLESNLTNAKVNRTFPIATTFAGANQHVLLPAFGTVYPGVTQALIVLMIAACAGILVAGLARNRLKEL